MLLTPDSVTRINEVEHRIVFDHTVHNLTIAGLHTYHVAIGDHDVLTHNTNCEQLELFDGRDYAPEYRGSTGPTTPHSLNEQLAMSEVRSAPDGDPIPGLVMTDSRWPATSGWQKYTQDVNGIEVHYVSDGVKFDDFKFKYQPPGSPQIRGQQRLF